MWIPEDLVQAVHAVAERMLRGGAARALLYEAGGHWGRSLLRRYNRSTRRAERNPSTLVRWIDATWSEHGLGRIELTENGGQFFIRLDGSYVAQSVPAATKPVCHLYAGLLAGLFSGLLERDIQCVEIMCLGCGYDHCHFFLGEQAAIHALEEQQARGTTSEQIVAGLRRKTEGRAQDGAEGGLRESDASDRTTRRGGG